MYKFQLEEFALSLNNHILVVKSSKDLEIIISEDYTWLWPAPLKFRKKLHQHWSRLMGPQGGIFRTAGSHFPNLAWYQDKFQNSKKFTTLVPSGPGNKNVWTDMVKIRRREWCPRTNWRMNVLLSCEFTVNGLFVLPAPIIHMAKS